MNIDSVRSEYNTSFTKALKPNEEASPAVGVSGGKSDQLALSRKQQLLQKLSEIPEIRPEAVVRGREIASDPNFSSPEGVEAVAHAVATAGDPSIEDL